MVSKLTSTCTCCCLLLSCFSALAQFSSQREYETFDYLYTREYSYGINFNTNGGLVGGFTFKHNRVIDHGKYHSFGFEAMHFRHAKEQRKRSVFTGESFMPNKRNYLYVFRGLYGREFILFQKADKQGVMVSWNISGGPNVGAQAPYLVDYRYADGKVRTQQYDPKIHAVDDIVGAGNVWQSFTQSKWIPGGTFKTSALFEFGKSHTSLGGFEAGFSFDAFTQKIELMAEAPQKSLYSSFFITLYFGFRK